MLIHRPQKAPSEAITDEQLDDLNYPVLGSPKLDGYRCTTDNAAYTSTMKLITNRYIQSILSKPEYSGLDGEIVVGKVNDIDAFNNTTGPVRRADGEPDFGFYVFDSIMCLDAIYIDKYKALTPYCKDLPFVTVIKQVWLYSKQDVLDYEKQCLEWGFEGAMPRDPNGIYKEGRCTFREQNIFKRKPFVDDEAIIIGFEEQMKNLNKKTVNEMGLTIRSSHKGNKVGKGTLGKFILQSKMWKEPFGCGTGKGLDNKLRQWIWDHREECLGKILTYKYQAHGSIDAPRSPIYKGFRDKADITDY
ncbi:hypothetical protein KAR91_40410 [Candidatus Pacearchaeota archaeon]|nr:hypothetical protein [Candidatus Pacearchaeota archaeon]